MEFLDLYNYAVLFLLIPLIALSFVAIKYTRTGWSRLAATGLFALAALYTFMIPLEFTSYPKSVTFEWYSKNVEEATVLWGGVHPDTKKIYMLLHWEGQDRPRYYTYDKFEPKEEGSHGEASSSDNTGAEQSESSPGTEQSEQDSDSEEAAAAEMRMGEELQEAMRESQKAKEKGGTGAITIRYPFLSPADREARMAEDRENEDGNGLGGGGFESDDSTFFVEPPPPPNPEKQ